ncbi:MAG: PAS domain-containing sensor histidine kinase [Ignavibacteriaceae bacterium]|nr:PAS domain-containing sensor histidine kinase [Ignavibacteriaceae bacterium]
MSSSKTLNKEITGKSTANALADSFEEKFRLLLDTVEDFIFILDSNGCFESASYRGAINLGFLPNELRKKHITEIVVDKNKQILISSIQQALASQKQISFNLYFLSKSHEEIKHQVTIRPIMNGSGVTGLIGICKNLSKEIAHQEKITALKGNLLEADRLLKVERQRTDRQKVLLEELNRLKNEFISQFSHEMRTPLSTIIGFSEAICSDDELTDSRKTEFQLEILKEAKRLAKAIDEALELTNLDSGRGILVLSELNCIELLKNVIFSNKIDAKNKNITLEFELPEEKCIIKADKERLIDVFDSLLKNSIKHSPRGSKIKVFGQIFPQEIELVFTDTGRGISQNDSKKLLNPSKSFQNISKAKSETGIGLDFAKKIVDLHNGYMDIQSEVDKGTTFIIKLPRN